MTYLVTIEYGSLVVLLPLLLECHDNKTDEDVDHEEGHDDQVDDDVDAESGIGVLDRTVVFLRRIHHVRHHIRPALHKSGGQNLSPVQY